MPSSDMHDQGNEKENYEPYHVDNDPRIQAVGSNFTYHIAERLILVLRFQLHNHCRDHEETQHHNYTRNAEDRQFDLALTRLVSVCAWWCHWHACPFLIKTHTSLFRDSSPAA